MRELDGFFAFARERHAILVARMYGEKPPWTRDPVLQRYRFCNVFREDDTTTRWFREKVREPLFGHQRVLVSTIAFRFFNFVPTGEVVLGWLLCGWDRKAVQAALRPHQAAGEKLFTGAYLVKSPPGRDKVTGVLDCVDAAITQTAWMTDPALSWSLQDLHSELMEHVPYLGRFMAYEVVTDLRHTYLGANAPDVLSWASAGPGCARGLGWVCSGDPAKFGYQSDRDQRAMLTVMREVLDASREEEHWFPEWPRWEMREVEHVACEYDKYRRAQRGQKLKRLYAPPR